MASRVSEPIVLASYNLTQRAVSSSERSRHVHAHVASSAGELVTIAVQGDGVHILDTSSMHSVASYALGPSTTFACAAPSLRRNAGPTTTYAALRSSDTTTELHSWSGSITDKQEGTSQLKHTHTVPHAIHSIYARKSESTPVLLVARDGQVLLADGDLHVVKASNRISASASIRKAFVFDAHTCAFLPTSSKSHDGTAVLLLSEEEDVLSAHLITVGKDDEVSEPQDCGIKFNSKNLVDMSCDASGYMSVLASSGSWELYMFEVDGISVTCTQKAKTVQLSPRLCMAGASILAVGASHFLLAATATGDKPELVILLWDLRYSAVIGHFSRPIPTLGTPSNDNAVTLELVAGKASRAVLVVSPSLLPLRGKGKAKASSTSTLRSTIFMVPCSVPQRSSIASALGRAAETTQWTAAEPALAGPDPNDEWAMRDAKRDEMLDALQVAMAQASRENVEKIFFDWLAEEVSAVKRRREARSKKAVVASSSDPAPAKEVNGATNLHVSDTEQVAEADQHLNTPQSNAARNQPNMTHKFVTRLLGIILGPDENMRQRPYPWQITKYLVERQVMSQSMVQGGIVSALLARGDWTHIVQCLKDKSVPDIPETELLRLLKIIITRNDSSEAMDVDASGSGHNHGKIPQLVPFLSLCLSYPTSPPALRAAIREHLTSVEDVHTVLKVLDAWIGRWTALDDVAGLQSSDTKKHNKLRIEFALRFNQTLAFLQTLLDACFLMLVQNPSLQPVLQSIQERIAPQLELRVRLETLRGPLEQFSRHLQKQKEKERESNLGRGNSSKFKTKRDERSGYQQPVGVYQVEQLTIWH